MITLPLSLMAASSALSSWKVAPAPVPKPMVVPANVVWNVTALLESILSTVVPRSIASAVKLIAPFPAIRLWSLVSMPDVPVSIDITLLVVETVPISFTALSPLFNVNPSRAVTTPRFATLLPKSSKALPPLVVTVNVFAAIAPESVMFPPLSTVKLPVTVRGLISKAVVSKTDTLARFPPRPTNVTVPPKLFKALATVMSWPVAAVNVELPVTARVPVFVMLPPRVAVAA